MEIPGKTLGAPRPELSEGGVPARLLKLLRAMSRSLCGLLLAVYCSQAWAGSLPDEFYEIRISTDLNADLIEVEDSVDSPIAGVVLPDSQSVAATPDSGNAVTSESIAAENTPEAESEGNTGTSDTPEVSAEDVAAVETPTQPETETPETQVAVLTPETESSPETPSQSESTAAADTSEDQQPEPIQESAETEETQVAVLTPETESSTESPDEAESNTTAESAEDQQPEPIQESAETEETQVAVLTPETESSAESPDEAESSTTAESAEDQQAEPMQESAETGETQVAVLTPETETEEADQVTGDVAESAEEPEANSVSEQAEPQDGTVQASLDTTAASPQTTVADETPSREQMLAAVDKVVEDWSQAWADQDVDRYLEQYSLTFIPADSSLDWASWKFLRYTRLTRPTSIELSLADIEIVKLDAERATVVFNQTYRSNLFRDEVVKSLELVNENGQWKISAEEVLETIR